MRDRQQTESKERKALRAAEEQKARELVEAFARIAANDDGVLVLRYLMGRTGYFGPAVTQDPVSQEINPLASIYNNGRRSIWLDMRNMLPFKYRVMIENPEPEQLIDKLLEKANKEIGDTEDSEGEQ